MGLLLSCSYLHGEDNSLQSAFYTDQCSFRKWHLNGTYFSQGSMSQDPLVACTFGVRGRGYAAPQSPFFQLTGLESLRTVVTLWPREMITSPC